MFALLAVLATLSLHSADNGKSFTVKKGTAIVITLASNPSTGYRWMPEVAMAERHVVHYESHHYVPPRTSRPGAAGKAVFRFRATGKGVAEIRLVYRRPWEKKKPARRFDVTIHVD